MPIGTGSINRASRTSKKTAKPLENKAVISEEKVVVEETEKTPQQKVSAKKSSAKKPVVKAEKETTFVVGNECCHLTEELPIHLL